MTESWFSPTKSKFLVPPPKLLCKCEELLQYVTPLLLSSPVSPPYADNDLVASIPLPQYPPPLHLPSLHCSPPNTNQLIAGVVFGPKSAEMPKTAEISFHFFLKIEILVPELASKAEIFINNLINRQRVGGQLPKGKVCMGGGRQLKCLIAGRANEEKTVIIVIHWHRPIVSSVLTEETPPPAIVQH